MIKERIPKRETKHAADLPLKQLSPEEVQVVVGKLLAALVEKRVLAKHGIKTH